MVMILWSYALCVTKSIVPEGSARRGAKKGGAAKAAVAIYPEENLMTVVAPT